MDKAQWLAAYGCKIYRHRCTTWHDKLWIRSIVGTGCLLRQEQSLSEPSGTVEQIVIKDGVFVVDAGAGANHGFAGAGRVPRYAKCWTKVVSWDANSIAKPQAPKIKNVPVARRTRCDQACCQPGIKLRTGN